MIVHPDGCVKDDFDYLNGKDFREINEAAYGATLRAHSEKDADVWCLRLRN